DHSQGEDIIDFGMGNPYLATPPHVVEKLLEAARKPRNHRYSASRGITKLRFAISDWYRRRFDVPIDPESEAIVVIGVKEGLSHLALAIVEPGDVALRSEEHTSELQSRGHLVCRLLLVKKKSMSGLCGSYVL